MSDEQPDTRPFTKLTQSDPASRFDVETTFAKIRARVRSDADLPLACLECADAKWVETPTGVVRCPACARAKQAPSVPVEFHDATLLTYAPVPGNELALRAARRFVDDPARDLFVFGGIGTGKTRLACTILNELYARTHCGTFVRVHEALHRLQPGDDDLRAATERMLQSTPVLVLDDLAAERDQATDFTRRTLLLIYEWRGDRGLRTIWTSNKSLEELTAFFDDERLVSRIAGRSEVVEITTPDQRLSRRRSNATFYNQ